MTTLRQRIETAIALKRDHDDPGNRPAVVTVRMPHALHRRLKEVARAEQISLNRLMVLAGEQAFTDLLPPDVDGQATSTSPHPVVPGESDDQRHL